MAIQIIRVFMLIIGILCVLPIVFMSYDSIFFDVMYAAGNIKTARIMVLVGIVVLLSLMAPTRYTYKI